MSHCESYLHYCTDFARLATLADWEKIFAVNVTGVFLSYKYAAQKMIALNETHKRGRRIIGASSLVGKRGVYVHPWVLTLHKLFRTGEQYLSAYSASKFAVRGITQSAGMLSIYIVCRRFWQIIICQLSNLDATVSPWMPMLQDQLWRPWVSKTIDKISRDASWASKSANWIRQAWSWQDHLTPVATTKR